MSWNVATWNVNSVRAREPRLQLWLEQHQPDVLLLQETKVDDARFPRASIEALGYHCSLFGQKGFNGVAVLSRQPVTALKHGFEDGEPEDEQSRFIRVFFNDSCLASVYVPNGGSLDSDKYEYKLRWLERLLRCLRSQHEPTRPLLLGGDFNIIPDARDCRLEEQWLGTALYAPAVRALLQELLAWGLADLFRKHEPEGGHFSWWDYRGFAFPKNDGARIDFLLATASLAAQCSSCIIDRDERRPKKHPSTPSDHAPVVACFEGALLA